MPTITSRTGVWRRTGRDQAAWGWAEPPWFGRVCDEARAVRERAGIIDLSSFGKIDVAGPGALGLLQRVAAGDMDRPVGSVIYTPFLNDRGGMVADVTITRLAGDRFRVVTGAGFVASDVAWLRHAVADDDVQIRDVSGGLATIGLWGPQARTILAAACDGDVDDGALPIRQARTIEIGGSPVLAARISYAGELGWELAMDAERAVGVWDALWRAGTDVGLEPFGYRALDSLRIEKGYRYFGTDMTMLDTPDEAGLGRFVRSDKPGFIGRAALLEHRERKDEADAVRLRTLMIGDEPGYHPIFGGEAVRLEGTVIGRLRSVGYGTTVSRTLGYVYLPSRLEEGSMLEVDVFDERLPATVAADVLVDPTGLKMRG